MFQEAVPGLAKLKVALAGPSGSGKTMSALRMASAISDKIAVIDTENGSASLYAKRGPDDPNPLRFRFKTVKIMPPFTAQKYVDAINEAERQGFDVIIVDSFSHAWSGEGGALDRKSALDARGGNGYANWRDPKAEYAKVKNAILHSTSHVICTIRSKQEYVLVEDGGKQKPQKMGMGPIAEPLIEYEFTVVFDLAMDNKAQASKDRTSLFRSRIFEISEQTGQELMEWLSSGKATEAASPAPALVEAKPVPDPFKEPEKPAAKEPSGIFCPCGAELIVHKSGMGLVCPNAKQRGDEHLRVEKAKIEEFKKRSKTPVPATA